MRGLRIQEHEDEFRDLRNRCWDSLAPVGPVEEMLVDRIVTAQWRLRRVLLAETGEIVLSVDGGRWKRARREAIPLTMFFDELHDVSEQMRKSSQGLEYLRYVLEKVREGVERDGELTEKMLVWVLQRFINEPNALTKALTGYRERFVANADELSAEESKGNHQRAVFNYIEMELESYAELSRRHAEREDKDETARQAADVLPSAEVLDKILRYESALERQLYRAMNQLERLQRRREGEDVPPPLTMQLARG